MRGTSVDWSEADWILTDSGKQAEGEAKQADKPAEKAEKAERKEGEHDTVLAAK